MPKTDAGADGEIRVKFDAEKLVIRDLDALETGRGLYELLTRTSTEATLDGKVVEIGDLPLFRLREIADVLGEAIKGLSDPNA